jgi:NAD-dependent SIR2 family protein deacetylase
MEEKKIKCRKCEKEFPATADFFHRLRDGFMPYCKPCRSEMHKKYKGRIKNKKEEKTQKSLDPVPACLADGSSRRVPQKKIQPQQTGENLNHATPNEIMVALRRGFAREMINLIEEKWL